MCAHKYAGDFFIFLCHICTSVIPLLVFSPARHKDRNTPKHNGANDRLRLSVGETGSFSRGNSGFQ